MDSDKLSISRFNGQEYSVWKIQMMAFLEAKGIADVLTQVKSEANKDTYEIAEKKAKAHLLLALDAKHVKLVYSCRTSKEIWERLSRVHEQKSASNKIVAQASFFEAKMDPSESVADYISRVEHLAGQLSDLGEPVPQSTLVGKIVSGLPQAYSNFMSNWLSTRAQDMNMDYLLPRLIAEESIKKKFDGAGGSALTAQSYGQRQGKPRNSGDKLSEDRRKAISELKKRTKCRLCGKRGHWKKECPESGNTRDRHAKQPNKQQNDHEDSEGIAIVAEANFSESTEAWIIDSGATEHMSYDHSKFVTYRSLETPRVIRYGNNGCGYGIGIGDIKVMAILDSGKSRELTITNVLHVPDLRRKLLSVKALTDRGSTARFCKDRFVAYGPKNQAILIANRYGSLYRADLSEMTNEVNLSTTSSSLELWHERLAHVNLRVIKHMVKYKTADGVPDKLDAMPESGRATIKCISCALGKQHHRPYRSSTRERVKTVGERVHVDVCGPIGVDTIKGSRYFVLFKDEHSNYRRVYFVRTKDQVFESIQQFVCDIRADTSKDLKRLVSDRGSELINSKIHDFLLMKSISQEYSAPFTPQQNGFIERDNRTIAEAARSMLYHRKLPECLWGEAVNTAVYLLNRVPNSNTGAKSPFEIYFGRKPRIGHIRVFGSLAIAKQQAKKRSGYQKKLEARGKQTILVGYERDYTYRVFDPETKKVIITRDIEVDERLSLNSQHGSSLEKLNKFIQQLPSTVDKQNHLTAESSQISSESDNSGSDFEESNSDSEPSHIPNDRGDRSLVFATPSRNSGSSDRESPEASEPQAEQASSQQVSLRQQGSNLSLVPIRVSDGSNSQARERPRVPKRSDPSVDFSMNLRPRSQASRQQERAPSHRRNSGDEVEIAEALLCYGDEPTSYEEAIQAPDAKAWIKAMDDEIDSLHKNQTWKLCKLPEERKPITCKWVFKVKRRTDGSVERYKARLVVRGFSQRAGLDYKETFSPVVRLDSIRILLAIAANEDLELVHFDVRTAFLHGSLEEDIYMLQPSGYEVPGDLVCKLQKSLYGLKQASRAWNSCFVEFLRKFDLVPLKKDSCILVRRSNRDAVTLMIAIYVDDGLACSNSRAMLQEVIQHLKSRFEISVMDPTCFVGLQIYRDRAKRALFINQSYYISKIIERFNMSNTKPVTTPADVGLKLTTVGTSNDEGANESPRVVVPYREAIGSLLYAVLGSRPDIAYIVSYLARFSSDPRQVHWAAVKRVFKYLAQSQDLGIVYGSGNSELYCYVDADHANDLDTRKSVTGFLVMLNGGPVAWKSTKQANVATSTAVAEFVAASMACVDVIWARQLLTELGREQKVPNKIFVDNQAAVKLVLNQQVHSKTKHIDITFMFIRDEFNRKRIDVQYLRGENQIADMLTKALPRDRFARLCKMASMCTMV